jgi:hypothetical protein
MKMSVFFHLSHRRFAPKPLATFKTTVRPWRRSAMTRVFIDPQLKSMYPSSQIDDKVRAAFALEYFAFYECNACHKPYYAGLNECDAAPPDPAALLCTKCSKDACCSLLIYPGFHTFTCRTVSRRGHKLLASRHIVHPIQVPLLLLDCRIRLRWDAILQHMPHQPYVGDWRSFACLPGMVFTPYIQAHDVLVLTRKAGPLLKKYAWDECPLPFPHPPTGQEFAFCALCQKM